MWTLIYHDLRHHMVKMNRKGAKRVSKERPQGEILRELTRHISQRVLLVQSWAVCRSPLGQRCKLQTLSSFAALSHGFPPNFGAGLSHVRVRCCVPPPHRLVQAVHAVHGLHWPSIGTEQDRTGRMLKQSWWSRIHAPRLFRATPRKFALFCRAVSDFETSGYCAK